MNPIIWRLMPVLLLVACHADETSNKPDTSSILAAAEQGDLQQLDQFLLGKQLVNMRDACLFTPLMKAALNGHYEAVVRLVEKGAGIDLVDKGGYTAMMLAASNNFHQIVEYLVNRGANINHVEHTHGWNALIWAAKRGHVQTVKVLLKHQPDKNIKDNVDKTALDYARQQHFEEVMALLGQQGK